MHISFYRRPLFLILIIYAAAVALFVKVPAPAESIAVAPPAEVAAAVKSFPRVRDNGVTFEARVLAIDGKEQNFTTFVNCAAGCRNILKGDKVLMSAVISPIDGRQNFGSFDRAKFYARKKIFTQTEASSARVAGVYSYLWGAVSKIRNSILNVFNKNLDADLSAIVSGITIGENGDLPRGLYTAFQDSGAMHLLVASGSNVGFVVLLIYFVCSLFGARRPLSAFTALALAGFYVLIVGGDMPIFRAYIMTLFATVGFLLGRKSGILHGLIMSALLILLINPQALFEASFQMSFLATLAIILFVSNFKINFGKYKLFKKMAELFFISLCAQLALLPVFANYFYKISFTAVISNILLVPLSGVILGAGFLTWGISLTQADFLLRPAVSALEFLLVIFKIMVEFFAGFPMSRLTAAAMQPVSIAAYYAALFALLNLPLVKRKVFYGICCGAVVFALLLAGVFTGRGDAEHILHGNYGKALLLRENGKIKIIGAGVQGDILRRAVLGGGSRTIDCLFLNGLNKSAVYGLNGLEGLRVKNIFIPPGEFSPEAAQKLPLLNAKITVLEPGDSACGVEAANPWYTTKTGGIFVRRAPQGNLSYGYKNLRTAGGMKDIITQAELAAKSLE